MCSLACSRSLKEIPMKISSSLCIAPSSLMLCSTNSIHCCLSKLWSVSQLSNTSYCAWTLLLLIMIPKVCLAESWRDYRTHTVSLSWLFVSGGHSSPSYPNMSGSKIQSISFLLDNILFLAYIFRSFCLFKHWKHSLYIVSDNSNIQLAV